MAKEIERKFLVKGISYRTLSTECHDIRQGYLSRDPQRVVRIRTVDKKGFITVKGKTEGFIREEFEYQIPFEEADRMLALCLPPVIEKKRYIVPHDNKIWEVDEFLGHRSGLTVAEIELKEPSESFSLPEFIDREVTGDPSYYNSNL